MIIYLIEHIFPVSADLSFETNDTSEVTAERLNFFLTSFLYSPQIDADPEASWTFRWDNQEDMDTVANQLVGLFNALMQSPEYQLM